MKISNLILICIIAIWSLFNSLAYACDLCGSTKPRPPRDSYTSYMMCAHPPSTTCESCPAKPRMTCTHESNITCDLCTSKPRMMCNHASTTTCDLCPSKPRMTCTHASNIICDLCSSKPRMMCNHASTTTCDLCPPKPRMMCTHTSTTTCESCPPKPRMMCESCPQNPPLPVTTAVKPVAAANDYEEPHMEGFYIGINGGYGIGDVKSSIGLGPAIGATSGGHIGARGVAYGLHAGYQKQFSDTGIIGLELGGGRDGVKGYFTAFPLTASGKGSSNYSAAIRGGLIMNYWIASIKIGIEESKFKYSVSGAGPGGDLIINSKKRVRGNLFGVGFETMVSDSMMFGGEWTLTSYDKSSGTAPNGAVYTFKPKLSLFKIRLGYLF